MRYLCPICGYEYDEASEGTSFLTLPDGWVCPLCAAPKSLFELQAISEPEPILTTRSADNSATATSVSAALQPDPRVASPMDTLSLPMPPVETVADAFMQALRARGLRWVFGMVGHSNLGLADAIRKLTDSGHMGFIGIRHEGAAAFAAAAYGKLMGRPAACLSIAGPGATNMLTGLWDARMDGVPAIALTGQVESSSLGFHIFQEIDLAAAYSGLASAQYALFDRADYARVAAEAYDNAILSGGVSQVIAPDDVQISPAQQGAGFYARALSEKSVPTADALAEAVAQINSAAAPIVVIGEGARDAIGLAVQLAERLHAPILTTYRAKGFVPDSHPLCCGVIGRSGNAVSTHFFTQSDCAIALGVGFSRHSGLSARKITVQIDRNPRALGLRQPITCGLLGDVGATVEKLLPLLAKTAATRTSPAIEIAAHWERWRAQKRARAAQGKDGALSPAAICAILSEKIPAQAIVSVDVGNVAYAFGRYFEAKDQRFLLSWYLGSIGVGLPAALGAWCATQETDGPYADRPVFAVVGDGGLGQYLSEWTTVVKYGMAIKCIVFNNSELAKISREQEAAKMQVWRTDLINPSFADYAKLCGAFGVRVTRAADLSAALDAALAHAGPAMVEIMTDPLLA